MSVPVSFKLDGDLRSKVEAIAVVERCSMSALIREAVADLVERRLADPEFNARAKVRVAALVLADYDEAAKNL